MDATTLQDLQRFASSVSRSFTKLPVKIKISDLPSTKTYKVVAKSFTNTFVPNDKKYKPRVIGYEIVIDRNFYVENKNNRNELKQAIIHELAHLRVGKKHGHNPVFKRTAKEMGADKTHQNQYWA